MLTSFIFCMFIRCLICLLGISEPTVSKARAATTNRKNLIIKSVWVLVFCFVFVFSSTRCVARSTRHLRAAMSHSSSLSTSHACSRLSWAERGGTPTVLWKETKPKVILPSSSSGAGVWCLPIFQFDEHDKSIKIVFSVNHSGREEVLTSKPKDVFYFILAPSMARKQYGTKHIIYT